MIAPSLIANEAGIGVEALFSLAKTATEQGAFEEARSSLVSILELSDDNLQKAGTHTLIAKSYIQQKDWNPSLACIERAEELLKQCQQDNEVWGGAMIDMLLVKANVLYFNGLSQPLLDECLDQLNPLMADFGSSQQRLLFYMNIYLSMLRRHHWYNLPLEAITHSLHTMELAKKLNNASDIVHCYAQVGMVHIFRNEYKEAISFFKSCLDITGEKANQWLPLVFNYLAVSYRMTGKVNECERWARKSLESSIEQKNIIYEAMSKANLAYICIKRGDYAGAVSLGEYSYQTLTQVRHNFIWLTVMPLIAGLIQQNKIMECGPYVCTLFYPIRKRLPEPMENSLRQGVQYWWQGRKDEMVVCLNDALFYAELTGHL